MLRSGSPLSVVPRRVIAGCGTEGEVRLSLKLLALVFFCEAVSAQ